MELIVSTVLGRRVDRSEASGHATLKPSEESQVGAAKGCSESNRVGRSCYQEVAILDVQVKYARDKEGLRVRHVDQQHR